MGMMSKRSALVSIVALAALAASLCLGGCKTVESTAKVDDSQVAALQTFPYDDLQYIVSTYVSDMGKVKYADLKKDRVKLDQFVALLAVVGPTTRPELFQSDDAKLAYYINAYNAFVLFNVLESYPEIGSVYDNNGTTFFYTTSFKMDGGETNLYNLENETIRPVFNEPRVHFALNCASESCPRLPNMAFTPEQLQDQLHAEALEFLHEKRNVSVEGTTVTLSQIFEWYADDFKPPNATKPSNIDWIRAYAPDLNIPEQAEVKYTPYDWKLNDQDR